MKLLTPVKQWPLCSSDLHRKTSDFASCQFLCARFMYLRGNDCLYGVLHFELCHPHTCGKASLDLQEKRGEKQELNFTGCANQMHVEMDV